MLSQSTIDIVKSTAPILQARGTEITGNFYEKLFSSHPELLNIFNHANQRQGSQKAALANAVYAAAANIDNLAAILPVVRQIGHKHRSLGIQPEHYPIVGENLLAAMKDVLGDAATLEVIGAWAEAYGAIAGAFISVEKEMYDSAAAARGGWRGFRRFVVDDKVKESDVITSFYLVPEDDGPVASFLPGQYVSLRVQIPGEEYTHIRQYSLSDISGKEYYRISVKREDAADQRLQGIVSNYLHASVLPGDVVEVSAPAGEFILDTHSDVPVVLLSGGVGLTPMISMLKSAVHAKPARAVTFIHAAISGAHHALRSEVEHVVKTAANAKAYFAYEKPTSSDADSGSYHHEGYITMDWLQKILPQRDARFYICGPLPFMKAMYGALKSLGVRREQVHYEVFGPALNLEG